LTDAAFEIGDESVAGKVPARLLLNPELSRLAFDERIIAFAEDPAVPLLERVRFLGMTGDRLDDFFMSRVARFKRLIATGENERTIDGLTAGEQLDIIAIRVNRMVRRANALLEDHLLPELESQGIHIERWESLPAEDREFVWQAYGQRIEALVTPMVAAPTLPFPHIRNLRPALAANVRAGGNGAEWFVAIELASDLPRFLPLAGGNRWVVVEDAIKASLPLLYPGMVFSDTCLFRVTRSANMDLDDDPDDMLRAIEDSVARRPFQEVVRLECERAMPTAMRRRLLHQFQQEEEGLSMLHDQDVYAVGRILDLASLDEIAALDKPQLKFPPLEGRSRIRPDDCMLDHARRRDLLLRFPDDDFEESVERFLHEAADDPDVVRIAITVYRTSKDSAIVAALRAARAKGKEVTVVIELKASRDEQHNIAWARDLEPDGIRVILTPVQFKVHAKIALIVRREGDALQRVAYIGTGNMNSSTARSYVDFGLLTADADLTREIETVFDILTGDAQSAEFRRLIVAPFEMRQRFLELIDREIAHARAGRPAGIRLHINGLADRHTIGALYRASQAGVRIDMMVRDICALRPGLEGISENIRVVSVVGRLLHHARILHFTNGGADEYFIGSADWRPRNFYERVEVVAQIRQPDHQAELNTFLTETLNAAHAWRLQSDGEYVRGVDAVAPEAVQGNRM
jgi:polyphosphate kinase